MQANKIMGVIITLLIIGNVMISFNASGVKQEFIHVNNKSSINHAELNTSDYIDFNDWISHTEFPMNYTYSITIGNRTITYHQGNISEHIAQFKNETWISKNATETIEQNKNILLTGMRWPVYEEDGCTSNYSVTVLVGFNDSYFVEIILKQRDISDTEEIITLYKVYSGNYTQSMVKALATYYNLNNILPNITIDYTFYQLPFLALWNANMTNNIAILDGFDIAYRYPENAMDLLGEDHWEILTVGKHVEMKYLAYTVVCISMDGNFKAIYITCPPPVDNNNYYISLMIGGGIIGIIGAIVILKKYKH